MKKPPLKFLGFLFAFLVVNNFTIWAAPGDLVWKMPTTGNYIASSPAISFDGTIYFGSSNGNLYAVTPDGKKKWQYHTNGPIDDSPAIDKDGNIYFGSFDNYLYALKPDGNLLWRFSTNGLIRSTPALAADGTIVFGSYDRNLYVLNPDGTLKWKYQASGEIASSPLISIDGTVYFGDRAGQVYALSPRGSLIWKYATGGIIHWSSAAAGYDGILYIGSFDEYLYAIFPDGTLKWKFKTGDKIGSSPALGDNGAIYVESCDSYFYAINPDGALLWKYAVQNKSFGCHPVVGSDGTVYVGSDDGHLYALNPEGTLKWKYRTGGSLWTTGATINETGILYTVSSDGYLYALDTGAGSGIAHTSWPKFHGDVRNSGSMETVSLSSSLIKIRDIKVNETGTSTVVMRNNSSKPVTIKGIRVSNGQFKISPESGIVMPSDSLYITITFSPKIEGEQQAFIMIELDDREIPILAIGNPPKAPVRVTVRLITRDADTGELLPCRIFLIDSQGQFFLPGLSENLNNRMFFVSPGDMSFQVFSGAYYLSIARGNEYVPIHDELIKIPGNNTETCTISRSLKRWIHMKEMGWYSCDNQVNNYDRRTPESLYIYQLAEDLNILHLICMGSYNTVYNYEYFRKGVFPFSQPFYPMTIGEEWRSYTWQNHMVIMNHSQPLSTWGNGFYDGASPYRYSYPPAMDACDETHAYGGIVTATHPFWFEPFHRMENVGTNRNLAFETPADIALGKMDGMQIYMYWQYDEWNRYVWYRLLNCGFKIPPFAGSDALLNNTVYKKVVMGALSGTVRSYAYVPEQKDRLDYDAWIKASVNGRSFVSSGAVVFFTVNGELPGSEIHLDAPNGAKTVTVTVDARWIGGLEKLYFIVNGATVEERTLSGEKAVITKEIPLTGSSWISCRVEGSPFDDFEGDAHSGPVYVILNNKPVHSREDAMYFAHWIDQHIALLDSANHFEYGLQKEKVFSRYREAQKVFYSLADEVVTKVYDEKPEQFTISPNSPNPFNSSTTITYSLPAAYRVSFDIYDILGRKIATLENRIMPSGSHRITWNGTDDKGNALGSNVYLYQFRAGNFTRYGKMVLVK
ncbi:MAG: PQQ-binding-like beta-propeller repeat protein [Candidatus Latescibacter sp.]|nr:PQQ-binding-like beta-propeller repeat protein [Candidatus Latescibacter sp.]